MPYYLFECHHGDENDNSITDEIYDAPSVEDALSAINDRAKSMFDARGAQYDGDDTTHTCLFNAVDYCPGEDEQGQSCDNECGGDHRTFHWDHYLQSEHATEREADEARQRYHSNGGVFHVNTEGGLCDLEEGNEIEDQPSGISDCVNYTSNTNGDCEGPHMFRLNVSHKIYCEGCYRKGRRSQR